MMNEKPFTTAQYVPQDTNDLKNSKWSIQKLEPSCQTPWCQLSLEGLFADARPIIVDVREGETLYLPSLWYHSVLQIDEDMDGFSGTIAVNWWYDMDYGPFSVAIDTIKHFGRTLEFGKDWQTGMDISSSDASDSDDRFENI